MFFHIRFYHLALLLSSFQDKLWGISKLMWCKFLPIQINFVQEKFCPHFMQNTQYFLFCFLNFIECFNTWLSCFLNEKTNYFMYEL